MMPWGLFTFYAIKTLNENQPIKKLTIAGINRYIEKYFRCDETVKYLINASEASPATNAPPNPANAPAVNATLLSSNTPAANTTGRLMRKEYLNASALAIPIISAPIRVNPLLEAPGSIATAWNKPTIRAST